MAARAIHTGLIFRVIVRAIHLGRSMPFGVYVSHVACLDESDSATSRQACPSTDISIAHTLPRCPENDYI